MPALRRNVRRARSLLREFQILQQLENIAHAEINPPHAVGIPLLHVRPGRFRRSRIAIVVYKRS